MYVITDASGNTGIVVAKHSRERPNGPRHRASADRLKDLSQPGAEPFVCDLTDHDALTKTFTGARAVYAMIPPSMASVDCRADQDRTIDSIAAAIQKAGGQACRLPQQFRRGQA